MAKITDEIEETEKLNAENLKFLDEVEIKDTKHIPEKVTNPDFDEYHEVNGETPPEIKLEKGQTKQQIESESEDYF